MRELIFDNIIKGKNKYAVMIYVVTSLSILFMTLPFEVKYYELMLYKNYHKTYYNELILELLKIILPFGGLLITIEHDKQYLNNLTPTIGRTKLMLSKLINYTFILFLFFIFIQCSYINILFITNKFILYDVKIIKSLFLIFLDTIIISYLIVLLTRTDRKIIGFVIFLIYLLSNYLFEAYPNINLYYFIPFQSTYFTKYLYTNLYKILYISLLFVTNIIYINLESFR